MALFNSCGNNFYQSLPACADGFTVKLPELQAGEDYTWILTDKFGHVYSDVATVDEQNSFVISADEFPDGFFNPFAGQMVLEIKGNPYDCDIVSFVVCDQEYDRFVIEFKQGDIPALIPCNCD